MHDEAKYFLGARFLFVAKKKYVAKKPWTKDVAKKASHIIYM